jgi:hypothetical protein
MNLSTLIIFLQERENCLILDCSIKGIKRKYALIPSQQGAGLTGFLVGLVSSERLHANIFHEFDSKEIDESVLQVLV